MNVRSVGRHTNGLLFLYNLHWYKASQSGGGHPQVLNLYTKFLSGNGWPRTYLAPSITPRARCMNEIIKLPVRDFLPNHLSQFLSSGPIAAAAVADKNMMFHIT